MTLRSLSDDVALVTGASAGIGRATALALGREGAAVALAARREDRLESVAEEVREAGGEALVVPTDVREEEAVEAAVSSAVDRFGRLDALVANAGVLVGGPVEELDTEDYRRMMGVNVDGAFFSVRAALPHLRASGGYLVFVGSYAGQYPRPMGPVYAATKWWVRGFARSLAGQVGDDVGVTVVNPSEVRTGMGSMAERFDPGEAVEPEEVAEAVLFALRQSNASIAGLDVYRRDKLEGL